MDKQLSDFIWQGVVVVMFLLSFTMLLWISSEVDKMHFTVNEHKTSDRVVTAKDSLMDEEPISGDVLYMTVYNGVEVPYIIEGTRIEVEGLTTPSAFWLSGSYNRTEIVQDGELKEVIFERIP